MLTVAPTRPILRYPGGKWLLAPWIIEHFPPHRCYVEPFAGAASVLLRKPRSYAEVVNDLDGEVVNLFEVLRDPARAAILAEQLRLTPYARAEFVAAFAPTDDPIEWARRYLVRSWQGWSGGAVTGRNTGWRSCSDRARTLPSHDWAAYPRQIAAFTARLAGVILEQRSALDVIIAHDSPTTLFYVDPPYVLETCPGFHGYRYGLDEEAQLLVAESLQRVQGMALVSGYPSPLYDQLYPGWLCVSRQHFGGGQNGGRNPRTECLWLNPACQAHLAQGRLFPFIPTPAEVTAAHQARRPAPQEP